MSNVMCGGCNDIFESNEYLVHITGGYCKQEFTYANTYEDVDADDEMDDETRPQYLNSYFLDNPDNRVLTAEEDIINNMMKNCSLGLAGYIDCYGDKITITEETHCPICLDLMTAPATFYVMVCSHSFCENCALRWFSSNCRCPICNQNLQDF